MTLLTGSTGMIGRNLKELLPGMLTPTHDELDLTKSVLVKEYLRANKPDKIIHCASNDDDVCLYDNVRMFNNLAESGIPMISFCTGREIEDRNYKNGEYVLSKHITKEFALYKYSHISVLQIWGCFGKYERPIRFFADNIERIKKGLPIKVSENKRFSYVYINDLVQIVNDMKSGEKLKQVVAYTYTLVEYAEVLKDVSGSKLDIIVDSENMYHSYVGNNTVDYQFTTLHHAVEDLWRARQ